MTRLTKEDIIEKAKALGFADIGFTTAEPFISQKEILESRRKEYAWLLKFGADPFQGTDPKNVLPDARSIIVVIDSFFGEAFPSKLEAHFGRTYLNDDRKLRRGYIKRLLALRDFLREAGLEAKIPPYMPHRLAAARAGLGTFGKNCLFYARNGVDGASWNSPVPIVVNREFAPDTPSVEFGCPEWCRNACIAACPTRALQGQGKIDPRRCISFLTYYGQDLPPREIREAMGLWVYGCDRCQNVCPRNAPRLAARKAVNEKVAEMEEDFELPRLLHMDEKYYETRIQPHMFYMPSSEIWRWKMNTARAMGNSLDPLYAPDLIRAFRENDDERVRGMAAWALGRIGGPEAKMALESFLGESAGGTEEEILHALGRSGAAKTPVRKSESSPA